MKPLCLTLAATLLLSGCIDVPEKKLIHNGKAAVALECTRPAEATSSPLPSSFSLFSWNIYKQQGDWQAELNDGLNNHDLLLLQEANASPDLHQWLHQQDYHWFQVAAFNWHGVSNGVLTAAKGHASQACGKRLLEPATRIPKSVLFSYYPLAGSTQQLLVANLHAVNFSLRGRTYNEQLDMISEVIGDYSGPVIVAGDFNRWNGRREGFLTRWAKKEQLTEALPAPDVRTRFWGYPLDAVFYRGLTLDKAQSLASEASDHSALQVHFSVP
ncbi:endonuclease/exonuclease/phosphatase family protein [Oceanisphaera pacifica]|uniref:Endonuclease/exonuclease/phosphatase family protein n=1 Tax=Oceanisphaera pacifica TaxID=2818389 RepID=A0ABS3NGV8_9GAMM|nr:endonuclease/exonuclease/phosphatase family protein [Oceanisphaera pacifica]MBO1519818.1 endonuclease/exonuclease/phosphatase family protein [Oceanisphaera pacifica]